jgi:hypothetical protein
VRPAVVEVPPSARGHSPGCGEALPQLAAAADCRGRGSCSWRKLRGRSLSIFLVSQG